MILHLSHVVMARFMKAISGHLARGSVTTRQPIPVAVEELLKANVFHHVATASIIRSPSPAAWARYIMEPSGNRAVVPVTTRQMNPAATE